MQIPTIAEQTLAKLLLWGEIRGFGANGNFSLVLSDFFFSGGYFNSRHYNKSKATIKYLLLGATEEVMATVRVSTPNAMRYAHRPTHGALL